MQPIHLSSFQRLVKDGNELFDLSGASDPQSILHKVYQSCVRIARVYKERGNTCFLRGEIQEATRLYSHALHYIELLELEYVLPDAQKVFTACHISTAQCFMSSAVQEAKAGKTDGKILDWYSSAKMSCDKVLRVVLNNKAYYIRALCCEQLGDVEQAIRDATHALEANPDNEAAAALRDRLRRSTDYIYVYDARANSRPLSRTERVHRRVGRALDDAMDESVSIFRTI